MKYFPPELYERFNSPDDDIASQADEEWDQAVLNYQAHLGTIDLPHDVKNLCLHDAEFTEYHDDSVFVFMVQTKPKMAVKPPDGFKRVRFLGKLLSISYTLAGIITQSFVTWKFSKENPHWLYDEFDVELDHFVHRILFSDGRMMKIPFSKIEVRDVT